MGDWVAILDPELDPRGSSMYTNIPSNMKKNDHEFITRLNLVDKFCNEHLRWVEFLDR